MTPTTRRAARRLGLPAFGVATLGWLAGLDAIRHSASSAALVLSTACGLLALASLVTWQRARSPMT